MTLTLYIKAADPYSQRMLVFLTRKGLRFNVRAAEDYEEKLLELKSKAPLLMKDNEIIGDFEKVTSLDLKGELDALVNET